MSRDFSIAALVLAFALLFCGQASAASKIFQVPCIPGQSEQCFAGTRGSTSWTMATRST